MICFFIGIIIGYIAGDICFKFNEEKVIKWIKKWNGKNTKKSMQN